MYGDAVLPSRTRRPTQSHRSCLNCSVRKVRLQSSYIHDQGTEFVNKVNDKMCQLMGIQKRISTAYHPQTNGLDERWNQTLQTALRKVIDPTTQDDWDTHLDPIMAA